MHQEKHDALLNLGLAALIRLFISNLDEQKITVMVQRPALLLLPSPVTYNSEFHNLNTLLPPPGEAQICPNSRNLNNLN